MTVLLRRPSPRGPSTAGRHALAPLFAAVLALGCDAPPTVTPDDGHAPPSSTPASDAPRQDDGEVRVELADDSDRGRARPGALDPETARTETARILAEVSQARNLSVTRTVKVDVMDKPEIRAFAKSNMYEDTTPAELDLLGRIGASFGKLPVGIDPEKVYLDLLEEGVLGLYDPKRQTLFIGDFVSRGMLSMVVGHEIAHALQDMHFDLQKYQTPLKHQSDRETARRFLIEGEAQTAYFAWISGEDGLDAIEDRVLDAASNQTLDLAHMASPYPVLARELQMPYTDGTATVTRLVKLQGWAAVDALYKDLPDSSEQMLHLDKLLADEQAIGVKLDAQLVGAALPGLAEVWHDDIGEATWLAMLSQVETSLVARKACAGWGGDAFVAFDRPGGAGNKGLDAPPIVGAVVWDNEADAEEAQPAVARYLRKTAASQTFLERKGDTMVFGIAIPEDVPTDDVRKAAWRAVSVTRPTKGKKKGQG